MQRSNPFRDPLPTDGMVDRIERVLMVRERPFEETRMSARAELLKALAQERATPIVHRRWRNLFLAVVAIVPALVVLGLAVAFAVGWRSVPTTVAGTPAPMFPSTPASTSHVAVTSGAHTP